MPACPFPSQSIPQFDIYSLIAVNYRNHFRDIMEIGKRVIFHDLVSKPELNGKIGVILSPTPEVSLTSFSSTTSLVLCSYFIL
jgi:hypothetical protein